LQTDLANVLARFEQLRHLRLEDEEFLGHSLEHGRWVNIPTKADGVCHAKAFISRLIDARKDVNYAKIVIVTSGRYSRNEDHDSMYFRKYESDGLRFGHAETVGYEDEPRIALTDNLSS
jgi:hypothetical protein